MQHILSIQILRGLAALAIVVLHAFHDAEFLASARGWTFRAPDLPLGAGVDLFFVISGFVMVVASQRLFATPSASYQFLGRRIARIVPIYWATTTLFLLILMVRPEVLNSPLPDWSEVLRSYLFIPYLKASDGLLQPVYKLGWTLNYEMMFYLVFAIAIMLPARQAVTAISAFFIALVALGMLFKPYPGALSFWTSPMILEFVSGMWVGLAWLSGFRIQRLAGNALILAALVLILAGGAATSDLERVIQWGGPATMIIAGAAFGLSGDHAKNPAMATNPHPNLMARGLVAMGDASYALYLCHPFAIRLFRLVWEKTGIAGLSGAGASGAWAYIVVSSLSAVLAALVIYRFFEKPVTRQVQTHLGVGSSRSSKT